jgi:hypothetical protein
MSRLFDDASSESLTTTSTPVTAAPFTISAWVYPDANNIYICAVSIADNGSTKDLWYLDIRDVNNAARFIALDNAGSEAITTNFTNTNAWNHLLGRETSATDHSCMLNGDTGNIGTNATSRTPDLADTIAIGATADSTPTEYFSGRIAEVAIWDVSLTDAEGVMLSKGVSPLQVRPQSLVFYAPLYADEDIDIVGGLILTPGGTPQTADHPPVYRPSAQLLPFKPAVTGAFTLTAEAGAFAITGFDANLEQGHLVTAEAGAVAITGFDANLEQGYAVTAEAGAVAITGFDATFIRDYQITAEAGAVAITGFDANLEQGYAVTAEAGAVAITGFDANLEQGHLVTAEAGAFAITGFDATLTVAGGGAFVLTAEAGAVAITGFDANLEQGYAVTAEAGAVAITGFDATLTVAGGGAFVLTAEAGAVGITGFDANLEQGHLVTAEAGAVAITGFDANLEQGYAVTAEAGAVAITGFDATFIRDYQITAEAGAFAITGFDATLIPSSVPTIFQVVSGVQSINQSLATAQSINQILIQTGDLSNG